MDERSDIEKRLRRKCRGLSADEISDSVRTLTAIQAQTDKLAIREQKKRMDEDAQEVQQGSRQA